MRARAGAADPRHHLSGAPPRPVAGTGSPRLREIARWLDDYLRVQDYPEERNGVLAGEEVCVRALGVALEPDPALLDWVREHRLDALLLHRAWGLAVEGLPAGTGVLMYHLPFDEHLTLGLNPPLARALRMSGLEPLGLKRGRVIGMLGRVENGAFPALLQRVQQEFGGVEAVVSPASDRVEHIAVVGAMNDALVREAAARGATVYLTGQLRVPARAALRDTGMGAIAVGHRRSEEWGVRALAALLRERWPGLQILRRSSAAEVEGC